MELFENTSGPFFMDHGVLGAELAGQCSKILVKFCFLGLHAVLALKPFPLSRFLSAFGLILLDADILYR